MVTRKNFANCVLVVFGLFVMGDLSAQTISITAFRDTSIFQDAVENGNGNGDSLFIGNNSSGSPRRSILFFDFASVIPAGARVTSVQFAYNANAPNNGRSIAGTSISLHRALSDWGEGGAGGFGRGEPAAANDATWDFSSVVLDLDGVIDPANSTSWNSPGGDFAAASDQFTIDGPGQTTATINGLIDDVQMLIDNPDQNFGFFLLGDESSNQTAVGLSSREDTGSSLLPTLLVSFSAAAVPEPSAGAVLLMTACAAVFRRRRI